MIPIQITLLVLVYLLAINLVSMMAFVLDKIAAKNGRRRISEATLLGLALIGGTPGSILAQHLVRHKTHKQPFKAQLYSIAVLQIVFLMALMIPGVRALVFTLISDAIARV